MRISFQFTYDPVFLSSLLSSNMAAGQLTDPGINNAQGDTTYRNVIQ